MILLSSNAQQIFWLGRYLTRVQYLCSQFPFEDDQLARDYANAFALAAYDAASLNTLLNDTQQMASFSQQFQCAKDNIQDLRGVLSSKSYAELNQLIKTASEDKSYICDVVNECHDILEAESQDVFLFFVLGQNVEQLDRQLRLQQDTQETLVDLEKIIDLLSHVGWSTLKSAWLQLQMLPNSMNFYRFSDHVQQLFEVDV
jgi:uncharacterized alpha-E superfamily protein